MDQAALVVQLIDDGTALIEQLALKGVKITAAGWIRTVDDEVWRLYLAVPGVKKRGARNTYLRIGEVRRQMPEPFLIDRNDLQVIDSTDPIAVAAVDYQRLHGEKKVLPYRGNQLGGVSIEGAFIYPPVKLAPPPEEESNRNLHDIRDKTP